MKRFFIPFIFTIAVICSCTGHPADKSYLSVVSNISGIRTESTLPEGDPSIGLLIRFGNTPDSGIEHYDENTFYVFFLTEAAADPDGNAYNYVVYVPEIVKSEYLSGNGSTERHAENPFRWYLEEYLGINADTAAKNPDWMLELLIMQAGEKLPYPDKADVSNTWKEYAYWDLPEDVSSISSSSISVLMEDGTRIPFEGKISNLFLSSQADGPFAEAGGKYAETVTNAFYITRNGKMFFPTILTTVYETATGKENAGGNPFWKYLETYFGIPLSKVQSEGFQLALNAIAEADELPLPDPSDYI